MGEVCKSGRCNFCVTGRLISADAGQLFNYCIFSRQPSDGETFYSIAEVEATC